MESDRVAQILAFGPRRLAKCAPAGAAVPMQPPRWTASGTIRYPAKGPGHATNPEHGDGNRGGDGNGQVPAAGEMVPLGCRVGDT